MIKPGNHIQKMVYRILLGYLATILMTGVIVLYLLGSFIRFFPNDKRNDVFMRKNYVIVGIYSALYEGEIDTTEEDVNSFFKLSCLLEEVGQEVDLLYYLSKNDSFQQKKIEEIRKLIGEKKSIAQLLPLSPGKEVSITNLVYHNKLFTREITRLLIEIQYHEINRQHALSKEWDTRLFTLLRRAVCISYVYIMVTLCLLFYSFREFKRSARYQYNSEHAKKICGKISATTKKDDV